MELEDDPGLTIANDLMMADGFGEAMDLNPSMLASRATKMFMEGAGAPRQSHEPALATTPTLWLVKLARQAVSDLFGQHRAEVQESWGSALDQEEAVGYLIADALGGELVPAEARALGKKALLAITCPRTGAKKEDDKAEPEPLHLPAAESPTTVGVSGGST